VRAVLERAWWWAQDYAYAATRQVMGLASRVQPDAFHSGTERPVLIIPGIYENWHFMLPLIRAVHAAGHPVHVVTVLQWNKLAVPEAARLVARHLESQDLREVVIVAHSKGGLIGKYAMMGMDGDKRIDRMVAICSPFSGSRYARFMLAPSLRAFSPLNAITVQMAREENVNQHISSVFGPFDPHIPEGSVLPGARNIKLDVAGHFRILGHKDTVRTILEEIKLP
jgi:hypothetical protein